MPNAEIAFGIMGTELWSLQGLKLAVNAYRRMGARRALEFIDESLATCGDWLTDTFNSPRSNGLLAPWVLHTGMGPDVAVSGLAGRFRSSEHQLGRRRPLCRVLDPGPKLFMVAATEAAGASDTGTKPIPCWGEHSPRPGLRWCVRMLGKAVDGGREGCQGATRSRSLRSVQNGEKRTK